MENNKEIDIESDTQRVREMDTEGGDKKTERQRQAETVAGMSSPLATDTLIDIYMYIDRVRLPKTWM